MENKKASFLLYFDSYPVLISLPPDQRGWLLTVLYVYADRLGRGEEITMEEVLDSFPQLAEPTRVACGFMGANIFRDTQKWFAQRRARMERRSQWERKSAPAVSQEDRLRRESEDMERIRRLLNQSLEEAEQEKGGHGAGRS